MPKYTKQQMDLMRRFAARRKSSGTFRIIEDAAGNMKFDVAGEIMDDIGEAVSASMLMSNFATFTHGEVMPRNGSMSYAPLEGLQSRMVAAGKTMGEDLEGMTIRRYGVPVEKGIAAQLAANQFMFVNPAEENAVGLHFLHGGKRIPDSKINEIFARMLHMDVNDPKLWKRIKTMLSETQLGVNMPQEITVALKDLTKAKLGMSSEALAHGFDGLAIINPLLVEKHAALINARADAIIAETGNPLDHSAKTLKNQAEKLIRMTEEGGNVTTLRALGLKDLNGVPLPMMAKGDALIPSTKNFIKGMIEEGYTEEQARSIGLYGAKGIDKEGRPKLTGNVLTDQLGYKRIPGEVQSTITVTANAPYGPVHQDIQSLLAYGSQLDDQKQLLTYTNTVIQKAQTEWARRGTLTPSYRAMLERQMDPEFGNVFQQQRAARILAWADTGRPPSGDILTEGLKGIGDLIRRGGDKDDPFLLVPHAIQTHVRNAYWAKRFGFFDGLDMEENKLYYRENLGWAIHEQTIADLFEKHGTFDLDDALRERIKILRNETTHDIEGMYATGIRSPLLYGEASALEIDPQNNIGLMEKMFAEDEIHGPTVKGWSSLEMNMSRWDEELTQYSGQLSDLDAQLSHAVSPVVRDELLAKRDRIIKYQGRAQRNVDEYAKAQMKSREMMESFPEMSRAQLEEFQRGPAGGVHISPTRLDLSEEGAFEAWKTARPGWEEKANKAIMEGFDQSSYAEILEGLRNSGVSKLTEEQYVRLISNEQNMGLLGKYSNVEATIDAMREYMEAQGDDFTGMIPRTKMGFIVDTLIQGDRKHTPEEIQQRLIANVEGMAKAFGKGAKIDEEAFNKRFFGQGNAFWSAIEEHSGGRLTRDSHQDMFLDLSNPEEAKYAVYTRAMQDQRLAEANEEAGRRAFTKEGYVPEHIKNKLFSAEEYAAGDELYDIFKNTRDVTEAAKEGIYVGKTDWERQIIGELEEAKKGASFKRATDTLGYHMQQYFDESGQFTDEGVNVLGAMIQKKGRALKGIFQKGGLSELHSYTSQVLDQDNISVTSRPTLESFRAGSDFEDLPEHLRDIAITRPGARKKMMGDAGFGKAANLIEEKEGKNFFTKMSKEGLSTFFENPLARKGSIAAAGLVAFSAIYGKFRHGRPQKDMEGPELLPGGSFYEHMPDPRTYMPSVDMNSSPSGTTYNITTSGSHDPQSMQSSIEDIMGPVRMNSSYYSGGSDRIARPRFSQKMDRF